MNPESTVEYNSLSWVKAQLDDVLNDAQTSLNDYIENQVVGDLENCIEHVQLVYGTLQMVEVYGAAMLAEEMQQTATALLEGNVERAEDTYDVLMRAMLQLPDYLEGIQAGKKDAPISLMPLINDLRAARKEGLLTESVLFSPDVENASLVSDRYQEDAANTSSLQDEAKRLRTHYQLGLLDYIRNNKERVGLQRIKAVMNSLEKATDNEEVRRIWMVVSALVEGLMKQGIDANLSIKMLLGAIDRQLKLILDVGEQEFAEKYSRELVKNILYYIGLCTIESESISAVKEAYHLSDLMPGEDDDAASVGGLNADLFDTVSKGITEDLVQVKDVLELFMHSSEKDAQQLVPVADQLGKIADTYGMLGMGATRQSIMDQRGVIESIICGQTEISEQVVLGVASELLNAESELKDFIDTRSGFVDMNRKSEDGSNGKAVPSAEYRQVVYTVVTEGLKNFTEAKEAILSYVSGLGDKDQLDIILNRLEEVRGVAMMLPLGRVEGLIEKLQSYISVALLQNNHQADDNEQDTVADVVTAIEYFFEALSEGRPGVEQGLNTGAEAADKLDLITQSYGDVSENHVDAVLQEDSVHEESNSVVQTEVSGDASPVQEVQKPAPVSNKPVQLVDAGSITEYAILSDDADEEIVEIFIEEAVEVLSELHEYLPQWKENLEDEEALAVVRRSFHTLKGSGRLLGAEMIGEFSWKFENMLNRVIDKKINVSDTLLLALDEAIAVLPQLIEQLKGNREPIENIAQLMDCADVLSEGGEYTFDDAPVSKPGEVTKKKSAEDEVEEGTGADVMDLQASVLEDAETFSLEDGGEQTAIEELTVDELNDFEAEVESDNSETIELIDLDVSDAESGEPESVESLSIADTGDEVSTDEITLVEPAEEADAPAAMDLTDAESATVVESSDEEEVLAFDETDISTDDDFEIVIDEDESTVTDDGSLDIDPMLLRIYHDESLGHLETIRNLIQEAESGNPLIADKNLIRAFHTLYGSARTAEVEAISELSGAAEKYVKARQESNDNQIPEDAVNVLKDIEVSITDMLGSVSDALMPDRNQPLLEQIQYLVQNEIQSQLQRSWRDNATEESVSIDQDDKTPVDEAGSAGEVDLSGGHASSTDENVVSIMPDDTGSDELEADDEQIELRYGEIDGELIDIFLEEAEELLENCEETLGEIRNTPNSTEHIHHLQRSMHTLKGGARMADLTPVGDLTHNLESLVVLVHENKVPAEKPFFDLIQESLDALTTMLGSVKKRQPLMSAQKLNNRILMLMRGEVEEKRSVERFDVDLSQLIPQEDEEDEGDDISEILAREEALVRPETVVEDVPAVATSDAVKQVAEKLQPSDEDRPHWGERATDVNFKDSQEQVRVRSDLLNNLVNYAGEVNIYHARMGKQITDFGFNLAELTSTVVRLKEQLRKLEIETEIQIRSGYEKEAGNYADDFDPLEMDQYSTLQQLTRSLSETAGDVESLNEILSDITRDSETLLLQESRVSTDLQEGLMRTRMVRFGGLSSRLRRIVRQVSRELGKEVDVEIAGEASEVDRTVLDRIIAPLEHMLRNAVAHGIELPEARNVLGKSETGKINIDVNREGTDVVINIQDDGAGIDAQKIREKAIKLGFITEESHFSDHDVLQFILQSGFSTADEVTQVSGRGVGMDVVDSEIKQLGGVLDIDTIQGKGTRFTVRLPLTLAINQALLVEASDDVYAVPLASIEGVVRMTGHELQGFYDSANSHYEFNGVQYELKHLGGLLTGHQQDYSEHFQLYPVLLVHVGDQHFALHVDDMLGRREIVVKPVGMQIGAVRGIAGATILADGRVVLILEMSALVVAESLFKPHDIVDVKIEEEQVDDGRKTIMVVDDSITIRKITERMLKRYGIDVLLAKDGVDATNILQDQKPDLMLLDIEMPRMDGFEVASYVRNDERLKDLPIIMITSRTGTKHKDKAMEIGVNRYLGKPFQEDELVRDINNILNTSF